jgi:AAA domain
MTSLFKAAEITTAYLKMALMGFQGSGKTYTATSTAIGLVQLMRELRLPAGNKPIAFGDTEKGSDWMLPRVREAGLQMVTAKTRAFSDLIGLVNEAEANASVLLIDSLTHFWTELCDTYCAKKARDYRLASYRLQFQDWAYLKGEWRKFTDRFVNSNLHIIVCGRAGYEYDYIEDDDTKKKQLEKTGIKFKAEGEMGYEPDLLVLMERTMNMTSKADEHVAHVIKDRSTLLDGKEIADPKFDDFLPHIRCLNLGGKQLGVDTSRTSEASIPTDARDNKRVQRKIVLDEIESLMVSYYPSTSGKDKQAKIALLRKHFNACWTEIEEVLSLDALRCGYDGLHMELTGESSRYTVAKPVPKVSDTDSLPSDYAPPAKPDGLEIPVFLRRAANGSAPSAYSPTEFAQAWMED